MSTALHRTVAVGAVAAAVSWTLVVLVAWWLLHAAAAALDGGSAAATLQAVTAWTERPWVRHWLEPDEAAALRDGVDWLLGLGGGPAAWLGTALWLLAAAAVMVWAGGLLLAALVGAGAVALFRAVAGARRAAASR